MRERKARAMQEQLDAGVINTTTSEWASTVFLVRKNDGKMCFFVDYRGFNQATIPEIYPLTRMDDFVDSLGT